MPNPRRVKEVMMRLMLAASIVWFLLTAVACSMVVPSPELNLGAQDFEWSAEFDESAGDYVIIDIFIQVNGTTEWIKLIDDLPWTTPYEGPVKWAYNLPEDGVEYWFRTDILAVIDGATFEYSVTSDMEDPLPWSVARLRARMLVEPRTP